MMRIFNCAALLKLLARDKRGNTLAMAAAALFPIMALVGSAVDAGRGYLTRTRLQQSCDAGVLAGRKAQIGGEYTELAQNEAKKYFNFNFSGSPQGTTKVSFKTEQVGTDEIQGTASTDIGTTIMALFGVKSLHLNVSCASKMNLSDTDIMFVLDTTASMDTINAGDTVKRIDALKAAVTNFHDTLESAKQGDVTIRYGFMPFAINVNVGRFLKPEWMASSWTYPSRRYDHTVTTQGPDGPRETADPDRADQYDPDPQPVVTMMTENCNAPDNNVTETVQQIDDKTVTQPNGDVWTYYHYIITNNGNNYTVNTDGEGRCQLYTTTYNNYRKILYRIFRPVAGEKYDTIYWRYDDYVLDVSTFKYAAGNASAILNASMTLPIGYGRSDTTATWQGCIEERQTVPFSGTTIPDSAYDLDIDMVPDPSRPETQWGPQPQQFVYSRFTTDGQLYEGITTDPVITANEYQSAAGYWSGAYGVCPAPARKLGPLTASELSLYLSTLTLAGKTYPDTGLLWGARFLSATGIFANENKGTDPNRPIGRNLILMTDGEVETDYQSYTAYGWEMYRRLRFDKTKTPNNDDLKEVVEDRFAAICEAAKRKNITIWVVAFGTDLRKSLQDCSTGGRAYQADNADELNKAFQNIATQIAGLRVTR